MVSASRTARSSRISTLLLTFQDRPESVKYITHTFDVYYVYITAESSGTLESDLVKIFLRITFLRKFLNKCPMFKDINKRIYGFSENNWGLPCNNLIDAWRYLLSLFSSDEMIGNLTDNLNTEFSPKKICRCRGSKTAQNWSSKLFSAMRIFSKKN